MSPVHLRSSRSNTRAFHPPAPSRSSKYGLNASSLLGGAERGPYSGANPAACMYLRIVLRSQPVNSLIAWILIPCRCSSFSSCTSRPLNKFRHLLRMERSPVYHVEGWGKFNRHYAEFCIGADSFALRPFWGADLSAPGSPFEPGGFDFFFFYFPALHGNAPANAIEAM